MGQSQLLLIVLGVIVVGTAIIVGMNLFHTSAVDANRNGLNNDLLSIAAMSQAHYKKPSAQGGGDKNFAGFILPNQMKENENGSYTIVYLRTDQALFQGVGKETAEIGAGCDAGQFITHRILVFPDSVQIQQVY